MSEAPGRPPPSRVGDLSSQSHILRRAGLCPDPLSPLADIHPISVDAPSPALGWLLAANGQTGVNEREARVGHAQGLHTDSGRAKCDQPAPSRRAPQILHLPKKRSGGAKKRLSPQRDRSRPYKNSLHSAYGKPGKISGRDRSHSVISIPCCYPIRAAPRRAA